MLSILLAFVCIHSIASTAADYAILGIPYGSDLETVKGAYRKLALKWHPDRNEEADANTKFVEISNAYASLKAALSQVKDEVPKDAFEVFNDFMGPSFSFSFSGKFTGTSSSSSTVIQNGKKLTRTTVTDMSTGVTETTVVEEDLTTGHIKSQKYISNEKSVEL
jgi:DnaJ-class molecular chaperone